MRERAARGRVGTLGSISAVRRQERIRWSRAELPASVTIRTSGAATISAIPLSPAPVCRECSPVGCFPFGGGLYRLDTQAANRKRRHARPVRLSRLDATRVGQPYPRTT